MDDRGVYRKDHKRDKETYEIDLKASDPLSRRLKRRTGDRPTECCSQGGRLSEQLNIQSLLALSFSFTMIPTIMNIEALYTLVLQYQRGIFIVLAAIPLLVFALSFLHGVYDGREAPWRHVYALVVHGMSAGFITVAALFIYHILDTGSFTVPQEIIPMTAAFFGGWLLVLIVVKRAVDFSMLRSVRNPFLLAMTWVVSWSIAWIVDSFVVIPLPLPRIVLLGLVGLVVFIVLRLFGLVLSRSRS